MEKRVDSANLNVPRCFCLLIYSFHSVVVVAVGNYYCYCCWQHDEVMVSSVFSAEHIQNVGRCVCGKKC